MASQLLHVGSVLQPDWDERPIRVMAFDDHEVMYDSWWPHDSSWGFASLKGKFSYYRIPRGLLVERCRYLRDEPLSEDEVAAHRPELPLRLAISAELEWPFAPELPSFLSLISSLVSSAPLPTGKLYVSPFGPKGSSKKSILVEPDRGGASFPVGELLARAAAIQAPLLTPERPTLGIGLFRLGIQNRIPSYYLWGSKGRADGQD
jgi:hypothetical protein